MIKGGEFVRKASQFRDFISTDHPVFKPEANRYILYVSYACPWAHRTLIVRKLKGLDSLISVVTVDPLMAVGGEGWRFSDQISVDPVFNAKFLRDVYKGVQSDYDGRVTVPVLFDKKDKTIVNNESAEIIRMLNTSFNSLIKDPKQAALDLYPTKFHTQIDQLNEWIYDQINNGVYKSGFATTQDAYERNCIALFAGLDKVEDILKGNSFLVGEVFTEADVRLFTTMVRFAPVYEGHFKCNLKSIRCGCDYPAILRWMRQVYQIPGIAETVKMDHIKSHYYWSHKHINPTGVVALGNGPDLTVPLIPTPEDKFAHN